MKFEKVCVIGLGYIGLPTSSTFATNGIKVVGVDINSKVVDTLKRGEIHIHEPGLLEIVTKALKSGMLSVSTQPEFADAFIISVPTPFFDDKRADLTYVRSAVQSIVPYLRKGNLVVLESTSPPKTTTDIVAPILEASGMKAGEDFLLCYSPERVLPGKILSELVNNARVLGGINRTSAEAGRDLYQAFVKGEIFLTDATTAEMVKLMENTYRDINIAIANEFSRLAERFGVDVWEAIDIANQHPRVNILQPGPGVGGHCISVDPWFLVEAAPDITSLIRTSREVNDAQPQFVAELVKKATGGNLKGKKVAVLGLAYKANVDDLRESPAVEIAHLLQTDGALVTGYEPFKPDAVMPGLILAPTLEKAVAEADVIVFLLAHQPFMQLTPEVLRNISPADILVDAARVVSSPAWREAGYTITTLGVGK